MTGLGLGAGSAYHGGMTNPERVYSFLRENAHAALCDDCIAEYAAVKPRQQVNPIAGALGLTKEFDRSKGTCCTCKNDKLVTRSLTHG